MTDLRALPHQIQASERIVSRCINQRGLLVWHNMGTGKTLSAALILKNYEPDKNHVYAPVHTRAEWDTASALVAGRCKLFTFHEVRVFSDHLTSGKLDGCCVCVDEVHTENHKWVQDDVLVSRMIAASSRVRKLLLLTGTPIV